MTDKDLQRLSRKDHAMIRWIYRIKQNDTPDIKVLHAKLGLCDVKILMHQRRLGMFRPALLGCVNVYQGVNCLAKDHFQHDDSVAGL